MLWLLIFCLYNSNNNEITCWIEHILLRIIYTLIGWGDRLYYEYSRRKDIIRANREANQTIDKYYKQTKMLRMNSIKFKKFSNVVENKSNSLVIIDKFKSSSLFSSAICRI